MKECFLTKVVKEFQSDIPNGVYEGLWSGYTVSFFVHGVGYRGESSNGVRGMNIPCVITVNGGRFSVKVK